MTRKTPSFILVVGILLLIAGAVLAYVIAPMVSADNLEIMQNAKSAQEAAQAISSNNQLELILDLIGMFAMGMGAAISGVGLLKVFKK